MTNLRKEEDEEEVEKVGEKENASMSLDKIQAKRRVRLFNVFLRELIKIMYCALILFQLSL